MHVHVECTKQFEAQVTAIFEIWQRHSHILEPDNILCIKNKSIEIHIANFVSIF